MTQPSPPPTPPSCSDCTTKTQAAGGSPPTQSASRMWKASNGNTRVDMPQTSVIADLAGKRTIMLDHVKKEATVIPTPPAPAPAPPAGAPKPGGAAPPPPLQVHDLGKGMIDGHEVEGKKFVFSPPPKAPPAPASPQMPKMPQAPQPPKAPQAPQPGQAPAAPPAPQVPKMPQLAPPPKAPPPPKPPQPTVTEVWTSVKLKTPVLTKVTSASGEHTTYCKPVSTEEPHPSLFQIPPGYKVKS